jgi:uncharacterized Zn finger protein
MGRWDYYRYFPPSKPKTAKGGIKAQSKRGGFGASWWAKRWIAVLESFSIGARLGRGRAYARRGQVLDLNIDQGAVSAKVQGSRRTPYRVEIGIKPLPRATWRQVIKTLSAQFGYAAQLLAGEMPQDIEAAFENAGASLFPARQQDLTTQCSCPDWSNPCKHVAAVFYLLGEEFHRDPFLIFKLRGLDRAELMDFLGGSRAGRQVGQGAGRKLTGAPAPEPLTATPGTFWEGQGLPADLLGEVRLPPVPAALPKRLGSFPLWRGSTFFLEALEPIYTQASPIGLDVFIGELKAAAFLEGSESDRE